MKHFDRSIRIRNGDDNIGIVTFFADFDEASLSELTDAMPGVTIAAVKVDDWNSELSPWEAPAVFGDKGFGSGAPEMLDYITGELIPGMGCDRYIIGGYSLAGLFSLWACYESDVFTGCCASSPSVWFPEWDSFIGDHRFKADLAYLSLGDKESKTRNPVMRTVADRIELQYQSLSDSIGSDNVVLEWNKGNHFQDPTGRKVRSFQWMLDRMG